MQFLVGYPIWPEDVTDFSQAAIVKDIDLFQISFFFTLLHSEPYIGEP